MLPGRKKTLEVFVIKPLVFAVEGTGIAQLDERSQVFRAGEELESGNKLRIRERSERWDMARITNGQNDHQEYHLKKCR